MREIIRDGEWLLDQEEILIERNLAKELLNRTGFQVVEVATGVRRAGKSTILLWIGRLLKKEGKRVYYINFEDDRFFPDNKDFQKISSIIDLKNTLLLIDEPQNIPRWEKWIRRMHDRKIKIFLTGSNSRLLGTELASALGGRKKQHEVFPFSFSEFLIAKEETRIPVDQKVRMFEEYMLNGGYPYPVLSGDFAILSDYRNDIIERDIILRHKIREIGEFRNLMRFVMSHPGIYLSAKSIKGFLDISHVTLRKYLDYLIEAYAVIPLEKFSYSQKERILNPKKIYPIDNGLLIEKNQLGKLMEACIIQHLRRSTHDIFYWKDERGREVDIYLPDKKMAIQVVYSLTRENLKREEKSLESAKKKLKAKPLIVYLHTDVEPKYPSLRAPDFLENLDDMFSGRKKKKRS
ncbi:MAG: ATP-binding protein [Methanomassiliicoccales archaeon]|nr:MAG: ATP-binding protein [Methanomassiliicoccales archaeon]